MEQEIIKHYIDEDLDFIFIRAERNGKWSNYSLRELTTEEFLRWFKNKFNSGLTKEKDGSLKILQQGEKVQKSEELNDQDKLYIADWLYTFSKFEFIMIKRGKVRKEWGK